MTIEPSSLRLRAAPGLARRFDTSIASDDLRRLSKGAQKCAAHALAVRKTGLRSNDIDRVTALLDHQPGCFDTQVLDGFRQMRQ